MTIEWLDHPRSGCCPAKKAGKSLVEGVTGHSGGVAEAAALRRRRHSLQEPMFSILVGVSGQLMRMFSGTVVAATPPAVATDRLLLDSSTKFPCTLRNWMQDRFCRSKPRSYGMSLITQYGATAAAEHKKRPWRGPHRLMALVAVDTRQGMYRKPAVQSSLLLVLGKSGVFDALIQPRGPQGPSQRTRHGVDSRLSEQITRGWVL